MNILNKEAIERQITSKDRRRRQEEYLAYTNDKRKMDEYGVQLKVYDSNNKRRKVYEQLGYHDELTN